MSNSPFVWRCAARPAVLLSLGVLAAASSGARATIIYAIDNQGTRNAGTVGDRLIAFDSSNPVGTVSTVGATGIANRSFSGLDFAGNTLLYGVTGFNQDFSTFGGSELYTINQYTGAATLVGSTGLAATNALTDLSWNPVTSKMQALSYDSTGASFLYTINLGTGAATLVGAISGLPAGGGEIGLATDSGGVNYVQNLNDDQMYVLSGTTATAMSSLIGIDTNFSQGMVINWQGSNEWYLGSISDTPGFSSQVRLMNNGTGGTAAILGSWPNNGVGGIPQYETGDLAIPVPEPTGLALLVAGGALAVRRRRVSERAG